MTAGGRLYNVVVDTEQTGKLLLEKGKLKRRVTIIPLNRISGRTVSDTVVRTAQQEVCSMFIIYPNSISCKGGMQRDHYKENLSNLGLIHCSSHIRKIASHDSRHLLLTPVFIFMHMHLS